jgi:membrane peptidoglycan carboxypeptidase
MAGITVEVAPVVGKVTLDLSLDEALYVAGVLGNASQFHPTLEEWFPLHEYDAPTVWDTILDALREAGMTPEFTSLYKAAGRMVSFTPPKS